MAPDRSVGVNMSEIRLPALHPSEASFAAIRRMAGFYVDKTELFRDLLETVPVPVSGPPPLARRHQFFARPRRFGKTLLVNTLEAWFQGLPPGHHTNPEGLTADLEGMPAGWTSPAWLWDGLDADDLHGKHGWHPVLRLDLSRAAADAPADTQAALQAYLWQVAGAWYRRGLAWDADAPGTPTPASPPAVLLTALIEGLADAYDRRPVVLVDEYDAPVTEHLGTDADPAPAAATLRRFFRVLKDDEGLLYGVFVTGITRFARHHLFSAANNFTDISEVPAYGALCGFTENETARALAPYRDALAEREPCFRDRDILADWRAFYNGYRFSPQPEAPRVYNPFTLIHGLNRTLHETTLRSLAAKGRWPSAWSESGHPGLTARLAADTRQTLPGDVQAGALPPHPAPGTGDLARPDYARLMLDTGYYTWHGGSDGHPPHLDFPNREVAESWAYDILRIWKPPLEKKGGLVRDLRASLEQGNVPEFARRLETFVFGLARENLQGEACFRILLQSLFLQMAETSQAEKSTWGGRADHELRVGNRVYIFEVKYNRSAREARRQIRDRQYGREHLDADPDTIAVGLAFRQDLKGGPRLEHTVDSLAALLAEHRMEPESRPAREDPHRSHGPG